jgi:tetratricopeptide (TPR) repeat protein
MPQRTKVVGARTPIIWLLIAISVVVVAVLVVVILVIYPDLQEKREEHARLAEAEQHYQAGVAFQNVGDWEAAETEFKQVIILDATYKDTQARLVEVKAKQQKELAQAQAKAAQATATAQARAEATAAAATVEAGIAQATSVAATATTQAGATIQAQEAEAAATAEARITQATSVAATATAQVRATAQAQGTKATATAEALTQLEEHYQKGLGYMNLGRWEEAKAELEQVFEVDPNYKELQAKLGEVEEKLTEIRARTPTPMPATPTPTSLSKMVVVESRPVWTNTGLELQQGYSVRIEYVSGQWKADGTNGRWPWVGPEGCDEATRYYTLPYERLMSLIGRIGQSRPFLIGESREFVADVGGILSLGPNDDIYDDNLGSVTVRITVEKR